MNTVPIDREMTPPRTSRSFAIVERWENFLKSMFIVAVENSSFDRTLVCIH
ncbi:MAG: hypothetical protein OXT71_17675 [Acidobacteriota bacterium]|nr:hypothetical protein [Acidobacteriota bacterium]